MSKLTACYCLAATLLLAGCGTTYQIDATPPAAALDPSVSEPCDPVPDSPKRGKASMGELYKFSDRMVALYGECAVRDLGKYNWIKSQGH